MACADSHLPLFMLRDQRSTDRPWRLRRRPDFGVPRAVVALSRTAAAVLAGSVGTGSCAAVLGFGGLDAGAVGDWDQQTLSRCLLLIGSAALVVAVCSASALASSWHGRAPAKAPPSLAIVPSEAPELCSAPKVAEIAPCQPLPQLSQMLHRQVVPWLERGGASAPLAQTAAHAVRFLLAHMARSLLPLVGRRAGIIICPYELLPRVLAAQRAGRTLCAGGGAPPFSVREAEHWPRLRDCIDEVDWAGGLLLRPTGAVYAVLERSPQATGAPRGIWQAAAEDHPGVVALACEGTLSEAGPCASVVLYHGSRVLRMPAFQAADALSPSAQRREDRVAPRIRAQPQPQHRQLGLEARAYHAGSQQQLKLTPPPGLRA